MSKTIDYLGVEKDALASSIRRGVDLMAQFNLGPHTDKDLKAWKKGRPLEKIAAAPDRAALARAMGETGTRGLFLRMHDLFETAALVDKKPYAVRPVYRDLVRWGAFSGMMTHEYRQTDAEQDRKQVQILAERAPRVSRKKREEGMKTFLAVLIAAQPQQFAGIEEMRGRVLPSLATPAVLLALFDNGTLNERHRLKQVLAAVAGLPAVQSLKLAYPFDRYGIVVEGLSRNFNEMADQTKDICAMLEKALAPFYETDEVQMTAIGMVSQDPRQLGIIFTASSAAARAVMDAMPGHRIVDGAGRDLRRPSPKPPQP